MQVGQADLNHPVQALNQSIHQNVHRRIVYLRQDLPEPGQFHAAEVRDGITVYPAAEGGRVQPLPVAVGALHLGNQALGLLLGVSAFLADVPVQKRLGVLVVQPGHLRVLRLAPAVPGAVEQEVVFLFGIRPDGLVQVKQAGLGVLLPVPGPGPVEGILDAALVPGFIQVQDRLHVHLCDFPQAGAGLAHAVGVVEGEVGGRAHVGLPDAGKQEPQAGVQPADGPHGGAGVPAQRRLVHHHGGRQVVDALHRRLGILGQSGPHVGRVSGVHLPLGLGGDGIKDDAGLAGAGHAGKHRDFFLWDPERDIL